MSGFFLENNYNYDFFCVLGTSATLLELDHETRQVLAERFEATGAGNIPPPSAEHISHRLTAPISTNYIDTEKISFER